MDEEQGGRGALSACVPACADPGAAGGYAQAGTRAERFWQRDVWDTQLRSANHYHEKWEYVRLNPVRKELTPDPDAWPFQGEINALWW